MKLTIERCENGYLVTGDKPSGNPRSASEFCDSVKRVFATLGEAVEYLRAAFG